MLDKQQACITEALAPIDGGLDAAPALAQAIGSPRDDLVHHGTVEIVGSFPSRDRGFPPNLKPNNYADVLPPVIEKARFRLRNPPRKANDDLRGHNGFAQIVENIAWFKGPVWGVNKWIEVTDWGVDDDGNYYMDGTQIGSPYDTTPTGPEVRIWYIGPGEPCVGDRVAHTGDGYGIPQYVPLDLPPGHTTVTAITAFQATTSTAECAYDVKTTDLTVLSAGVESDWVTHVCNHCP